MLDREHLPRAPEARLHLVDDEHDAVLVADPADACEEFLRRHDESALPLHRLDHDRGDVLARNCRNQRALECGDRIRSGRPAVVLRERNPVHLRRERPQPSFVRVRLRGERNGEQSAPVEAAFERDHCGPFRVRASEFDGVLDRLGSGVEERGLRRSPEGRQRDQPLGERDVNLVRDDREVRVQEPRRLLLNRLDDPRVRVSDVEAADAAREVDERIPVDVRERRALAAVDHDGEEDRERIGNRPCLPREDLLRPRPWDRRLELDRLCGRHTAHDIRATGRRV